MTMKKALITGITGQDGAYLAEFLLKKGYEVHGVKRRTSLFNTDRIDHLYRDPHEKGVKLFLHHGDMTDSSSLTRIIQQVLPDEIYNLAAQSHVAVSSRSRNTRPTRTRLGALRILEAMRILGIEKKARFYQASAPALWPRAGGAAKGDDAVLSAKPPCRRQALCLLDHGELPGGLRHVRLQRILFNHESPMRGETFVTRKITRRWRASSSGCRTRSTGNLAPSVTGATPRTTSRCSGSCCSRSRRRIS
jgi:GDPmannose 4,6-dehydratase